MAPDIEAEIVFARLAAARCWIAALHADRLEGAWDGDLSGNGPHPIVSRHS